MWTKHAGSPINKWSERKPIQASLVPVGLDYCRAGNYERAAVVLTSPSWPSLPFRYSKSLSVSRRTYVLRMSGARRRVFQMRRSLSYDALAENASAREVMGEPKLRVIAHELVKSVKGSVTVDWMHREAARARMRVLVKRILRKYGYPPDLQDAAVQTVLQQAEALSAEWAAA